MRSPALFSLSLLLLLASFSYASVGIDLSTGVSGETMKCLKSMGYQYVIPRVRRLPLLCPPPIPLSSFASSSSSFSPPLFFSSYFVDISSN